jgi:hypothetical protein
MGVGIEESDESGIPAVYPNPVNDVLRIMGNLPAAFQACILNSLGAEILQAGQTDLIDVSSLPNGIYFLRMISGEQTVLNTKFIIQH